jgi:hypothetical protein
MKPGNGSQQFLQQKGGFSHLQEEASVSVHPDTTIPPLDGNNLTIPKMHSTGEYYCSILKL